MSNRKVIASRTDVPLKGTSIKAIDLRIDPEARKSMSVGRNVRLDSVPPSSSNLIAKFTRILDDEDE